MPNAPSTSSRTSSSTSPASSISSTRSSPGTLTRGEVARRLECSRTHVARLEHAGVLHPAIDRDTRVRAFDEGEVEALAARLRAHPERRRNGRRRGARAGAAKREEARELAARGALEAAVFQCFDDGLDIQTAVVRARVPIERVRELWREYETSYEDGERLRRQNEAAKRTERDLARARRERREDKRLAISLRRAELASGAARDAAPALPPLPKLGGD